MADVTGLGPDVVGVATGARPRRPAATGLDQPHVHDLRAVLLGEAQVVGEQVVVVAEDDHVAPLAVAEALGLAGHQRARHVPDERAGHVARPPHAGAGAGPAVGARRDLDVHGARGGHRRPPGPHPQRVLGPARLDRGGRRRRARLRFGGRRRAWPRRCGPSSATAGRRSTSSATPTRRAASRSRRARPRRSSLTWSPRGKARFAWRRA